MLVVRRILVIKDVGLWIALNRHFAGSATISLSEAPTLEMGLELAQIEKPELVVCSLPGAARYPETLERLLHEHGLAKQAVVCVSEQEDEPRDLRADFKLCCSDDFLGCVEEVIDLRSRQGCGEKVDLLAHFEVDGGDGALRRGFVNLIELSQRELLLETEDALELGTEIALAFFVPGVAGAGGPKAKIGLRCRIRRCHDVGKLLYVADLIELEESAEADFERFLSGLARPRES
jgi:hypothetical protein